MLAFPAADNDGLTARLARAGEGVGDHVRVASSIDAGQVAHYQSADGHGDGPGVDRIVGLGHEAGYALESHATVTASAPGQFQQRVLVRCVSDDAYLDALRERRGGHRQEPSRGFGEVIAMPLG